MMVGAAVGTVPVMFLLVFHVPSGPLLTFHIIWVALGALLWSEKTALMRRPTQVE